MEEGSYFREGFELRYRIEGEGIPTIVVGSSIYYPRTFSTSLRSHLKMAFVDWRGYAKVAGNSVTLDAILEDIECFREKMGFNSCVVMGHSAHALLALEYAKKYPEQVCQVVMIGAPPNFSEEMTAAAEKHWQQEASWERKRLAEEREIQFLDGDQQFVSWCKSRDPRTWKNPHFDSSPLWEGVSPHMPMLDFLYREALRDIDITEKLSEFKKPVLLALGRYDYIIAPPSVWSPLQPKFKDLALHIFEESGHSPQLEEAPHFDQILLQWLERSC